MSTANTATTRSTRAALAAVCVGFALVILDANVLNVAVPALREALSAGPGELLWTVDAYTVAFAALLLSTGLLCDRWGARHTFLGGLVVFTAGSVACALAPSAAWLIGARVVQGVGAALLAPASLALIHALYPQGSRRASALAAWAAVSGVAFAAGPLVGGALVEAVGWRSVFWLNVPVGIAALVTAARRVGATPGRPVRTDPLGQLLAAAALTALTAGLIQVGHAGWDPIVATLFAVAVVAVVGFLLRERHGPARLVPVAAVTSPPLRAGLLAGAAFNFTMYGSLFVLTLRLQDGRGWSPLVTGLALLPLTVVHAPVAAWLAGPWTGARGPRAPLVMGLTCTVVGATGFALSALSSDRPYVVLAVALAVFGIGSGLITTSMTALVLAHVPGDSVGVSCGLLNAARQLGGVLGVAVLGSLVVERSGPAAGPAGIVAGAIAVLAVAVALVVVATHRALAPAGTT